MTVFGTTFQFFPKHQIILDLSECNASSTTPTPTTATPTTPANQPISPKTCTALKNISITPDVATLGSSCEVTESCDSVFCTGGGEIYYLQLLPCSDPPTLFVWGSTNNTIIFQEILDTTSKSFSVPNLGMQNYIVSSTNSYITFQVSTIQEQGLLVFKKVCT